MTEQTIFGRVQKVIVEKLKVDNDEVTENTDVPRCLCCDDMFELSDVEVGLEKEFGIEITIKESKRIKTVKEYTKLINQKLAAKTVSKTS